MGAMIETGERERAQVSAMIETGERTRGTGERNK